MSLMRVVARVLGVQASSHVAPTMGPALLRELNATAAGNRLRGLANRDQGGGSGSGVMAESAKMPPPTPQLVLHESRRPWPPEMEAGGSE